MESVSDFLKRKAKGETQREDPVRDFLRKKAGAEDAGAYTPGVGKSGKPGVTLTPTPEFEGRNRPDPNEWTREEAAATGTKKTIFQTALDKIDQAKTLAAKDKIPSTHLSGRIDEDKPAITKEDVLQASDNYDKARANSFGASMALGAALTVRGQNPLSDRMPEVQAMANSAIARAQAAKAEEQNALAQFNSIAERYQEQERERKYDALRKNPEFAAKSKGDEETAREAAGKMGTSGIMAAYYQIYHRNDPVKTTEDLMTGLGASLLGGELNRAQQPNYTAGNDLSFIRDDEADTFFYLWNTQGPKAASTYLDSIRSDLNARRNTEQEKLTIQYAQERPVKASAESVLQNQFSIAGMVDLTVQNLRRQFGDKTKPIDYNTPAQDFGKTTQRIRDTVGKSLEEKYPDATALDGAINLASFLYQTGMSMADSGVQLIMNRLGVPQPVTLSLMAGGAAQQAVYDAKRRGASDGQALLFGYASGIAEYAFEKMSLDNLVNNVIEKTGASIGTKLTEKWLSGLAQKVTAGIIDVGTQSLVEGSEELFTSLANTVSDIMINQDKAELFANIQHYIDNGVDPQVASKMVIKDWVNGLIADTLGGLISGVGMGGTGTALRAVANYGSDVGQAAVAAVQATRQDLSERNTPAPTQIEAPAQAEAPAPVETRSTLQQMADKLAAGQQLSEKDAKAIMNDPQAMQTLRDAGLPETLRPGAEGRAQVRQAVEQYAQQMQAQTATVNAETPPVPQEVQTPAEQESAPQAEQQGLRLPTAQETLTQAPQQVNLLAQNRTEVSNNGQQAQAPAPAQAEQRSAPAQAAAEPAGRQSTRGNEGRGSGLGRFLVQSFRTNYQGARAQQQQRNRANTLRTQAEARGDLTYFSGYEITPDGTTEKLGAYAPEALWDDELKQTVKEYADKGVTLTPILGQIGMKDGTRARAYVSNDGKQMWAQIDHSRLSWQQLVAHEELHRELKVNPGLREEIIRDLKSDPEIAKNYDKILRRYVEMYNKMGITDAAEIEEEMLADYRAGFDMLKDTIGSGVMRAKMQESIRETERKVNNSEPVSVSEENKASREFDAKYMEAAEKLNEASQHVPASLMNDVAKVRETIKAKLDEIQDEAHLPADVEGNTYFPNSSYSGTEEITTVCPRSLSVDALADAVGEALGRPLTIEESVYVAQQAFHFTDIPQCLYCYVAMDRMAKRQLLGEYINKRTQVLTDLQNGMSRDEAFAAFKKRETAGSKQWSKNKQARFDMWVRNYESGVSAVSMSNLASENAVEKALKDPSLKAEMEDALQYAQNASWAKKRVGYTAYNNHILKWDQKRIDALNTMFGLRLYSFSDYSPAYILENMQMVTDAAVRGLKMLAYTKELDFVKIFAGTGMNINISTFGMDGGDGSVHEDAMQGAAWKEAQELRKKFPNVGITFVATNDNQVNWALDQDWIDVVIPFHMVRTGATVANILGYLNYTGESSDKKIQGIKARQKEIFPSQHQNNKEKYLAALEKAHLTPRFERWLDNPNYMKLVNETRRSAEDTPAVQPKFDQAAVNAAMKSLDDMVKRGGYGVPIGGTLENLADIALEMSDDIKKGIAKDLKEHNRQKEMESGVDNPLLESQREERAEVGSTSREMMPSESLVLRPPTERGRGRSTNPRKKVSRVRTRAFELGGLYNEVEAQMAETQPEEFTYNPISEKRSMNEALGRLKKDFTGEAEKLASSDQWGGSDLDTAMGILYQYRQIGRETGDYSQFNEWSHVIQQKGTKGGQFVQAFAKYSRTATGVAQKAAENLRETAGKLNPKQQKLIEGHVSDILGAIDNDTEAAARDAVEKSKGKKGLQLPGGSNTQRARDAENVIKQIHKIFSQRTRRNHGLPVEEWTKATGDQLAGKIASRLKEPGTKAQTTMQTILGDLVTFAQEHALPTQEARQHRTALDRITDYLNNREAYAEAWGEAKQVLRDMYADDPEKLEALESFLNATITYNGDDFDRTMFRAILEASDLLGMSKQDILNLAAVGTTESVINRIADEFVQRVGVDDATLRDTVRRHIENIVREGNVDGRLERMESEASKELDIKIQDLLRESRRTKADAANRIAQYLINDLSISGTDAAIAADHIAGHYMDQLQQRADRVVERMFAEKKAITKKQRDRLMDLIHLGGLTNANVEDAVVDALGLNKVTREQQRQIMDAMAQFADTLDAIENDDLEGLRNLIRLQAAVRNTKLDKTAEKVLSGETDVEYLRNLAMAQLDLIAADYQARTRGEKISTIQIISHLLNARTAMRNLTSNQVFDLVDTLANNVSILPDLLISKATGQRSVGLEKSWFSQAKRQGAIKSAGRNILEIGLDVAPSDRNKSKYGTGGRRTFSMANSGTLGKLISQAERVLGYELNTTDEFHKGSVFAETLESLAHAVDQGYMTEDEAKEFATQEALYRSFQDDTLIGALLGRLKETLNVVGTKEFGLGDFVVKYTQVPGALIHRAIEYSPLGYAKAMYNLAKLANDKRKGESTIKRQRQAALALGRATTGSGLITLFTMLVKLGLLRRGEDEKDKNAAAIKQSQGLSGTQFNVTALGRLIDGESAEPQKGDVLVDIGFLEPLDSLMTIAALVQNDPELKGLNLYEMFHSPKTALKTGAKSLQGVWLALENTSAMQTLSNIYSTVRYHDEENDLPLYAQIPLEIASGAVTGFVPAPLRQIAQATDTIYRDQYRSQNPITQIGARLANTIPGVRQNLLAPKLTPLGEPKKYQSPVLNALNALVNPGNISVYDSDEVRDELLRVYDATGNSNALPPRNAPYSITIGDDKYTLTPDERTQYQTTRGQVDAKIVEDLLKADWYQKVDADTKAEILQWTKNFSNYAAKVEFAEGRGVDYSSNSYAKYYDSLLKGTAPADVVAEAKRKVIAAAAEAPAEEAPPAVEPTPDPAPAPTPTPTPVPTEPPMSDTAKQYYDSFRRGGVSESTAKDLATTMDGSNATGHAQWREIYDGAGKEGEKAVTSVMTDDMRRNWDLAKQSGCSMDDYIAVRENYQDLNGNGKKSQDEWNATIDRFTFSDDKAKDKQIKGTLWQILTGSTSTKNNPYDKAAGQAVIDAKAGGSSGNGKTYSASGLRIPTPERREPITNGLVLPSVPKAKPTSSGLKLSTAPKAKFVTSGLVLPTK